MGVRVLIADDHERVREGVRAFLEAAQGVELVGEARDGREALAMAVEIQPDVILLDVRMPVMDGMAALRGILERCPGAKVVMFSAHSDEAIVSLALGAGALGYVDKAAKPSELVDAVMAAASGRIYLSQYVAGDAGDAGDRHRKGELA